MILVTGSLAFDFIMDFPGNFSEQINLEKLHVVSMSFLVNELRKGFGGTAGNVAYNLSLLGIKTTLLGVVGADFMTYKEFLDKHEVDTSYLRTVNNLFTSTAFGMTDKKDNQIWGFYSGADNLTDHLSINDVSGKIDFGIVAPHNPRAMLKFAQEYTQENIPYLFDPGMQLPWFAASDLMSGFKGAKIIIGNDYEMSIIRKKLALVEGTKIGRGNQVVITTLGEEGSIVEYEGKTYKIPRAKPRRASDPTGAGDAYRAGFLAGFMRGLPMEICGRMGSVAAVYTVETFGTTTHNFTLAEFARRFKENFGYNLEL